LAPLFPFAVKKNVESSAKRRSKSKTPSGNNKGRTQKTCPQRLWCFIIAQLRPKRLGNDISRHGQQKPRSMAGGMSDFSFNREGI